MTAHDEALLDAAPPGRDDEATAALAVVLGRVDRLLGRAVRAATATFGAAPAADPFRGLYVSDADAARLVDRGVEPLAHGFAAERPLVDLSTAGPTWRRLAAAFGLAPVELDALALALAPEIDLRYERVIGYLQDDVTRRRPTVDLTLHLLCRSFEERVAGRRLFAPDAPLVRYGLVQLVADAARPACPAIDYAVRVDPGVVGFLVEQSEIDARLAGAAQWEAAPPSGSPGADELARRVVRELVEPSDVADAPLLHFLLTGPNDRWKLDVARRVAAQLEVPLLLIDLERLGRLEVPFAEAVRHAARTARLMGALPFWARGDAVGAASDGDSSGGGRVEAFLGGLETLGLAGALLATPEPAPKWAAPHSARFLTLDFPLPDSGVRRDLWSGELDANGIALPGDDVVLLAEAFHFDGTAIEAAAGRAVATARWREPDQPRVTRDDLFAAARGQATRALPRFATRVEAAFGWDDIVLPPDPMEQLRELCERVRHRRLVLDVWGFAQRLPLGKGTAALFAGPSGTGKTMGAQVIAAALGGVELYRVEIPAVVSKYIGETEKALEQVFREAQGTSAILFFDEADALFGRRSEVKDAHDRYANIEVSYLLQALEAYDGLAILATNFRHNLDEAFVRRLGFIITFPYPEEPERRRIWERGWPPATPLGDDLDLDFLARQFKLTGGDIRNAALAAAFGAAGDGGRVTMAHAIRGVRREYQKMGKVCAESEFGAYFALLGGEGAS